MASKQTYVIVGANLCGGKAAETLRKEGFDGRLVLIGAEPERPYERPPLSKEYLRGEEERDRIFLRPAEFYDEQKIELRLGLRATRIDVAARSLELENGQRLVQMFMPHEIDFLSGRRVASLGIAAVRGAGKDAGDTLDERLI